MKRRVATVAITYELLRDMIALRFNPIMLTVTGFPREFSIVNAEDAGNRVVLTVESPELSEIDITTSRTLQVRYSRRQMSDFEAAVAVAAEAHEQLSPEDQTIENLITEIQASEQPR